MSRIIKACAIVAVFSLVAITAPLPAQDSAKIDGARVCAAAYALTQGIESSPSKAMLAKFAQISGKSAADAENDRNQATVKFLKLLVDDQARPAQIASAVPQCASTFGVAVPDNGEQFLADKVAQLKKAASASANSGATSANGLSETCLKIVASTKSAMEETTNTIKSWAFTNFSDYTKKMDKQCNSYVSLARQSRANSCDARITKVIDEQVQRTLSQGKSSMGQQRDNIDMFKRLSKATHAKGKPGEQNTLYEMTCKP